MAPPTSNLNLDVEAISGICGSVSIACWVVVFSPQIIQNFQRQSADALSVQFVIVWLVGDVFNILGAILQGVLPTMIILAVYYTIADIVLLAQCFYYRGFTWRDNPVPPPKPRNPPNGEPNERTNLIAHHHSPILRERRGSDWSGLSPAVPHIPDTPPPAPATALQTVLWNTFAVLMVVAAGILGWFLRQKAASKHSDGPSKNHGDTLEFNILGQFFGWLCAVSYIASRLPQLILNWRRKTTDGLSMLFFLFACLGNITYVLSIFAYEPRCNGSCAPGEAGRIYGKYMLVNLSWLAGALVTLLLDVGVFVQYFIYNKSGRTDEHYHGNGFEDDFPTVDDDHWDRPLLDRNDSR